MQQMSCDVATLQGTSTTAVLSQCSGSHTASWPVLIADEEYWQQPLPPVYMSALASIERHGWNAVHPEDEPPVWTVLHWAASEDRPDICRRLVAARADPRHRDEHGHSALDYAREAAGSEAWRVLSDAVADAERFVCTTRPGSETQWLPVPVPKFTSASSSTTQLQTTSQLFWREPSTRHSPPHSARSTDLQSAPSGCNGDSTAGLAESLIAEHETHSLPKVYAAAVAAVERYGWRAVHEGEPEWTALHWAAAEGRDDICSRLLRCNADPRQPDSCGRSALDYACESGNETIFRMLEEAACPDGLLPAGLSIMSMVEPIARTACAYPNSVQLLPREVCSMQSC